MYPLHPKAFTLYEQFEITTDSEKPCFLEAKDVVRKHLMKVIRDQLKQFQKDLIDGKMNSSFKCCQNVYLTAPQHVSSSS